MTFTLEWNGEGISTAVLKKSDVGVKKALDHLLKVAAPQTPYKRGKLRESGKVIPPNNGGGKLTFGGMPSKPVIAIVQHERTDFLHPGGGKAHYLKDPMISETRIMLKIIADEVRLS